MQSFYPMVESRWDEGARICINIDAKSNTLPSRLFSEAVSVVAKTHAGALAYKLNLAFYPEQLLADLIGRIQQFVPDVPIILDAKYGDVENTSVQHMRKAFTLFNADAVTINPYLGREAAEPLLDQEDKGIFVLSHTSNPGASEFQELELAAMDPPTRSMYLYEYIAQRVSIFWNQNNNCGLVAGATYPEAIKSIRTIVDKQMWLLVPGIGRQGGNLKSAVRNGINERKRGIIVCTSDYNNLENYTRRMDQVLNKV